MNSGSVIAGLRERLLQAVGGVADLSRGYALLDFPDYPNVGDSLIWLGELALFDALAPDRPPGYVCTRDGFDPVALRRAVPEGPIFLSGGGNFGDLWPRFQAFRHAVLREFPDRRVVQLPQTVHFREQTTFDETRRAIDAHPDFVMMVRDRPSLDRFVAVDCPVQLLPDVAFCLGELAAPEPVIDVVGLIRRDQEAAADRGTVRLPVGLSWEEHDWIAEPPQSRGPAARVGRRLQALLQSDHRRFRAQAMARLEVGRAMLGRGRVVITDRLHGHILSTLLRRPHVVLDNSYGKVSNFAREWTATDPCVTTASNLAEAAELAVARVRS